MKDRSESKTIADNAELLGEVRRTKERINNLLDIYEADKHEAELKSLSEKLSTLLENSNIPDDMV